MSRGLSPPSCRTCSAHHSVKASDAPFGSLFSWKNVLGHISKLLLDLLTSYSTAVIFHLWNGTLSLPTSSSAGGMISQRMSRTASVDQMVRLLQMRGPSLGRPHADLIQSSRHSNMKELRVQHAGRPYRVLFAFDPKRCAILLTGGDKTGNDRWYEEFVPIADRLYEEHLVALEKEKNNNG